MSTVPPYIPPFVDSAGLHTNSYQSILQDNLTGFLNIFGQSQVVDPSSAIYQFISILSLKDYDVEQAVQLAYNQSSPQTAVGAGLDRSVKMNGLARLSFTYSTATLTLTGISGIVITSGFAQDTNGNLWAIPSPTTLVGGSIDVVATCTTPGAVVAEPGQISIISSPVNGWNTVTNAAAAIPGNPVEPDSELRARQSISVARPSLTTLDSTIAAVLAVDGVVRVAPGYPTPGGPGTSIENPTGSTDSWGNPAHSVSMVVQAGTDAAVGQAIYQARGIGPLTNGSTSVTVTDPVTGYTMSIGFYRPTSLPIFVNVVLTGYGSTPTTAQQTAIQTAIVNYLNELAIGETVSYAALIYEIMSVNATLSAPSFGVTAMQIGSTVADSTTATFSSSSTSITVASATGIANGQLVIAAGIPPNTFVTGYTSGTTVNLTNATTAAGSGVAIDFVTVGTSDIAMPTFYTASEGVTGNVLVSG